MDRPAIDQQATFLATRNLEATIDIYHFFLRDPDGYLIEVQRFLDPAWPRDKTTIT